MGDGDLDLSGFSGRAPSVPPPPPPARPEEPVEQQPPAPTKERTEDPPTQRKGAKTAARSPRKATGRWAGLRMSVNVPVGVRRWIRSYARAAGLAQHEVVLEAFERHRADIEAEPQRPSERIEEGLRLELYLTGDDRNAIEALAEKRGWTLSETVTELLERERRSTDPSVLAARVEERLRRLQSG